jgi:hypothetical protein
MHEAYFGDVETLQTGLAYDVTLTCDPGLDAEADPAGKTPSAASTPTHTISRRVMTSSFPERTVAPSALLVRNHRPYARVPDRAFGTDLVPRTGEDERKGARRPPSEVLRGTNRML